MRRASPQKRPAPTLILGLGETGLSCARFLDRFGEPFEVADSRREPPGLEAFRARWPDVPVTVGPLDPQRLKAARRIVVSPGISPTEPALAAAVQAGVECIGDIELFAHLADAPVVAVTGSNGKSTVTTMVGAVLTAVGWNVRTGGNLGPPALDLLTDAEPPVDAYVLELSSFQLETTYSLRPAAATVLNVSPDHMDRYTSLAEYAAAKGRIYNGAAAAVVNRDDAGAARLAMRAPRTLGFTAAEPIAGDFGIVTHAGEAWLAHGAQPLLPAAELPLAGGHNRLNALAALALAHAAGIDVAVAAPALAHFTGLPHRTRLIAESDGVRWYNDSKGTNPGATAAALEGMDVPVVLIAGGDGKGADFSVLRAPVARRARAVIVFGRDGAQIAAALGDAAPVECVDHLDAAVARAEAWAQRGDAVLLSPACASFDMFADYRARGDAFAAAVERRCA